MEFIVSRNALLRALQHARHAIKGAHNTLCDFVMTFPDDPQEQTMTVHASNGEIWVTETVALDSPAKDARPISIWYGNLLCYIKKLDDQPLRFIVGELQMKVEHSCGSFRLPLSNQAEEFLSKERPCPDAEASDGCMIEYEVPVMKSVLNRCYIAMAQDELRPVMSGVFFRLEEDYSDYVASDGHKLVCVRKNPVTCVGNRHQPVSFIMPYNVVQMMRRILPATGDVVVEYQKEKIKKKTATANGKRESYTITERKAAVRITIDDSITISFNPIEGRYPNYQSVIPQYSVFEATVNRKTLLKSLERLFVLSPSSELLVMSIGDDKLDIRTRDKDFMTEANETMSCSCVKTDGTELIPGVLKFGVKATTVSDVLKAVSSEKVVFKIIDTTKAIIIKPVPQPDVEEVTLLIMPMIYDEERL